MQGYASALVAIDTLLGMGIFVAVVEPVDCIVKPKTRIRTIRIPVFLARIPRLREENTRRSAAGRIVQESAIDAATMAPSA